MLRPIYEATVIPVIEAVVAVVDAVRVAFGVPSPSSAEPTGAVDPTPLSGSDASPQMAPNDAMYSSQWHYQLIGDVETVWDDYSGAGVEVAVYDDGVETAHPDLNYDPQNRQFESYSRPNTNTSCSSVFRRR